MAHMNNFKIALKQKRETEKNKKQNRILIDKILDRLANLWTNILHQELGLFTIPFLCWCWPSLKLSQSLEDNYFF